MIEVSDRYSSVLSATNPGEDNITPVIEGFATLNGVKINNQKIISSSEHFAEDILNLIHDESIDMVFFPWHLSAEHETHDLSSDIIPEVLKIKSLTVAVLIHSGTSGVLNLSEAKLMVPFFGGPDDRKAVEVALSFGILTCIIYYKREHELDDDDNKLIEKLYQFSEKDPSVVYSVREFNEMEDDIVVSLREEYETSNFSLLVVGHSAGLTHSSDPSDLEQVIGCVGGKLIDNDFPSSVMVVKCGENCNFLNLQ